MHATIAWDEGDDEDRIKAAREVLSRSGRELLGPPSAENALVLVNDLGRLERMFDAILNHTVKSWNGLQNVK